MGCFNFRCVMLGHEDRVRRSPGRMYMECAVCGRETDGWRLGREGIDAGSQSEPARVGAWRPAWRQLRPHFDAVRNGVKWFGSSGHLAVGRLLMRWWKRLESESVSALNEWSVRLSHLRPRRR